MDHHVRQIKQEGFSLVEVVVAMFVLLTMSLATLAGLNMTYQHLYRSHYLKEAKAIARLQIEDALNTPFASLANGTQTVNRFFGNSNKTFTWTRNVIDVPGAASEGKICRVTVQWKVLSSATEFSEYTTATIKGNY